MNRRKASLIILIVLGVGVALSYNIIPYLTRDIYGPNLHQSASPNLALPEPGIIHLKTPASVKGIYMTSCVVGSKTLRENLVKLVEETELNTIIIDVKDYLGTLSFTPNNPELTDYVSDRCGAADMQEFIKSLHEKNIYIIGRITVFQDPFYTKLHPETAVKSKSTGGIWKDKKGISYIDPGSTQAWDHVVAIALASYEIGFDEINFDYIRFPSDGNMRDMSLPLSEDRSKPEVLESFFAYLNKKMNEKNIPISADLFGMTTTNFDDLGIGQVLERALPYFDYVMPMVYPSHYPPNFNGWKDPNKYPYDLIYYVMQRGVERSVATSSPILTASSERIASTSPARYTKPSWDKNKLRPWIQDFNYGGFYGPKEVKAQIQASYDLGLHSWIIWSPSNRYTRGALLDATTTLQTVVY